jgi:hypothetical protein
VVRFSLERTSHGRMTPWILLLYHRKRRIGVGSIYITSNKRAKSHGCDWTFNLFPSQASQGPKSLNTPHFPPAPSSPLLPALPHSRLGLLESQLSSPPSSAAQLVSSKLRKSSPERRLGRQARPETFSKEALGHEDAGMECPFMGEDGDRGHRLLMMDRVVIFLRPRRYAKA